MRSAALVVAAVGSLAAACQGRERGSQSDSAVGGVPGRVVDSARSLDDDLRRFRANIPVAPTRFRGGAESRESLVLGFIDALARADTVTVAGMALTRAEFAYLTYPSSPYTRAPYRQSPEIVWLLLQAEHDKGLTRLLRRTGGRRIDYLGHRCDADALREGPNRLWRGCRVRVRIGDEAPEDRRLFGVIIERDGHFKFANYSTDF